MEVGEGVKKGFDVRAILEKRISETDDKLLKVALSDLAEKVSGQGVAWEELLPETRMVLRTKGLEKDIITPADVLFFLDLLESAPVDKDEEKRSVSSGSGGSSGVGEKPHVGEGFGENIHQIPNSPTFPKDVGELPQGLPQFPNTSPSIGEVFGEYDKDLILKAIGKVVKKANRPAARLAIFLLLKYNELKDPDLREKLAPLGRLFSKNKEPYEAKTIANVISIIRNDPNIWVSKDEITDVFIYKLKDEARLKILEEYTLLRMQKEVESSFDTSGWDKEELTRSFVNFFRNYVDDDSKHVYLEKLMDLTTTNFSQSLLIDWQQLHAVAPRLAEEVLEHPEALIESAEDAIQVVLREDLLVEDSPKIHARFYNLSTTLEPRQVGPEHINKLIQIRGVVTRLNSVEPFVKKAVFVCRSCGNEMVRMQEPYSLIMKKPARCDVCGSREIELDAEKSTFLRYQAAIVQDHPEHLRGGQMPRQIHIVFLEDLCDRVIPGDRVLLTGILRLVEEKRDNGPRKRMVLIVNYVERENKDVEDIQISPEEERQILEEVRRDDYDERLIRSYAPSIFGYDLVKKGILLSLFSGEDYYTPTGEHVRNRVHVLLAGDPGTSKSHLLKFAGIVAPRAVRASGKGATGAGLTASAVRDELTGKWTIDAGTLVLADKGFAIIDELDKMSKEDRKAMHEPLEDGTIDFAKAGLNMVLNARATVIAAANPMFGRVNKNKELLEQIDIPPTLLSRFDLVFGFVDEPDEKRDMEIAKMIGKRRYQPQEIKPPYSPEFLQKLIVYARRKIKHVRVPPEMVEYISKQYVRLRKKYGRALTARFADGLYRLVEAHARMHLRDYATEKDVIAVMQVMDAMFRSISSDKDEPDPMLLEVGKSSLTLRRMEKLIDIIKALEPEGEWGAPEDKVIEVAQQQAVGTINEIKGLLRDLVEAGKIYQPKRKYYKVEER